MALQPRRPGLLLMRRLIFATQKLESTDPVLAATVAKVKALAERVDELVVLCDSAEPGIAPANVRVHEFGASTQVQRGARFAAALRRELKPRPLGVVAHMIPLYVIVAAPLVRPRRIPLLLWYAHWKDHVVVRAAERLATAVITVDRRSFPFDSPKVQRARARNRPERVHVHRAARRRYRRPCARARALLAREGARDDPARRGPRRRRADRGARHDRRAPSTTRTSATSRAWPAELGVDAELGGPVPRSEIPSLFARSHVLINNMRPGAPDKVVYEAAASCLPVLASNPVFDDLLAGRAPLRPRRPGEPRGAAADARPPPPARAARDRRGEPFGRPLGGRRAGYR